VDLMSPEPSLSRTNAWFLAPEHLYWLAEKDRSNLRRQSRDWM